MRIVVAIVTYRRPEGLKRTLASLAPALARVEIEGHECRVLVVDNDPERTADVGCHGLDVEVVSEETPGIAAARNRALLQRDADEAIAFVDDDEMVTEHWLIAHVRALGENRGGASFGPVRPQFGADAPSWVVRGGFFERKEAAPDGEPRHPATNNVLIAPWLLDTHPELVFSEEFSLTGGSDTDFFKRLKEASGARYIWTAQAVVDESVPSQRANWRWIWRRNVRLGNVSARVRFAARPRVLVGSIGAVRVVYGGAALIAALAMRRPIAPSLTQVPKGYGMMQWAAGKKTIEYARPAPRR